MSPSLPWGWIALGLLLLVLPTPPGRLLLDLLGGFALLILVLPLLAGGAALIGWQLLRRRLRTCPSCGVTSMASEQCPACGASLGDHDAVAGGQAELDPRSATITVDAVSVNDSSSPAQDRQP
jgi:hypothetical protein